MKKNVLKIMIIAFSFFIIGIGCNKEEPLETDPAKIILGKWELIEMGNYPNMEPVESPSGYREFLPDSVLREFEYETGEYYYKKYSIDTLLHEYVYNPYIEEYMLFFEYYYDFTNNNKVMHLNYSNFYATHNFFTHKRIE